MNRMLCILLSCTGFLSATNHITKPKQIYLELASDGFERKQGFYDATLAITESLALTKKLAIRGNVKAIKEWQDYNDYLTVALREKDLTALAIKGNRFAARQIELEVFRSIMRVSDCPNEANYFYDLLSGFLHKATETLLYSPCKHCNQALYFYIAFLIELFMRGDLIALSIISISKPCFFNTMVLSRKEMIRVINQIEATESTWEEKYKAEQAG